MDDRWQNNLIEGLTPYLGDLIGNAAIGSDDWGCESPIEKSLLIAWSAYWDLLMWAPGVAFLAREHHFKASHCGEQVDLKAMRGAEFAEQLLTCVVDTNKLTALTRVFTQVRVGDYRVDIFAYRYIAEIGLLGPIVIECDGKDFHDNRVEDLQRDRVRDRVLQTSGLPVLRFTGSEIFRNPIACIEQIEEWFRVAAHEMALEAAKT